MWIIRAYSLGPPFAAPNFADDLPFSNILSEITYLLVIYIVKCYASYGTINYNPITNVSRK